MWEFILGSQFCFTALNSVLSMVCYSCEFMLCKCMYVCTNMELIKRHAKWKHFIFCHFCIITCRILHYDSVYSKFLAYSQQGFLANSPFFIKSQDSSLVPTLVWVFLEEICSHTMKNACSTDICKVLPLCFNHQSRLTPWIIWATSILLKIKTSGLSHLFFLWQVLGSKHFRSLLWFGERTVSCTNPKATTVSVLSLDKYSFEMVTYWTREFAFFPADLGFRFSL